MVAVIFMVVSSITTYAAPQVMKDGAIFDAQDYADRYPDLKKVYGYNVDFLYPHYLLIGAEEGRTAIYTPAPQKSNNEKDIKGNKQITKHTPETDGYKMWTWYDMGSYMFRIVDKAEAYSSVVGGEEEQHAAMVAARYPGWKPSFGGAQMLDDGTERFVEFRLPVYIF